MVDYDDDKFKLGAAQEDEMNFDGYPQEKDNIHSDSIGEYKSEFIKIQFDPMSLETAINPEHF